MHSFRLYLTYLAYSKRRRLTGLAGGCVQEMGNIATKGGTVPRYSWLERERESSRRCISLEGTGTGHGAEEARQEDQLGWDGYQSRVDQRASQERFTTTSTNLTMDCVDSLRAAGPEAKLSSGRSYTSHWESRESAKQAIAACNCWCWALLAGLLSACESNGMECDDTFSGTAGTGTKVSPRGAFLTRGRAWRGAAGSSSTMVFAHGLAPRWTQLASFPRGGKE